MPMNFISTINLILNKETAMETAVKANLQTLKDVMSRDVQVISPEWNRAGSSTVDAYR